MFFFRRTQRRVIITLLAAVLVQASTPIALPMAQARNTSEPLAFAQSAFEAMWSRTDAPVANGSVKRTWLWGPTPRSGGLAEDYKQGASGKRLVQYFDKSRMEINNPSADPTSQWYVTNGLLTVELISGKMQTGDNTYTQRTPANINVSGDADDANAPTYASFAGISNASGEKRDPDRAGQDVIATLDRTGKIGQDASKAGVVGVRIAYYEKLTGHNIPEAMWAFLNANGPIQIDGKVVQQRLIEPWFYASGLPISDPYWAKVVIAGKVTDVLVQAYERRVLTYVPTNPEGFQVEMGNVGQHYYQWRYSNSNPVVLPTPTQTPPPPPAAPISRFAVDLNGDLSAATLDKMAAAGAGAARVIVAWSEIEPNNVPPAQYKWASVDSRLNMLINRGLSPIVLVNGCPAWACSGPDKPIPAAHLADFAEFMSAVAGHYGKMPFNTHYWEFWNEPDMVSEYGTTPDSYAAVLKAIRSGMKAADPNAKVVMGGLAYDNFQETGGPFVRGFLDGFLNAGGGQAIDYFNFHYYIQNINWCSLAAKLNELKAKLAAHKVDVPIISTETGFTSSTQYSSSPDKQSLYAAQIYAQGLGEGLSSVSWFAAKDFETSVRGWQVFKESGLLDVSGNPKPSYQAYRVAVSELAQRPVVRGLGAGDGVNAPMRGYEFGADAAHSGSLWVVWAWDLSVFPPCGSDPEARDFAIPANKATRVVKVLDMYGQPVATRSRSDGSLVFSLDEKPISVQWR